MSYWPVSAFHCTSMRAGYSIFIEELTKGFNGHAGEMPAKRRDHCASIGAVFAVSWNARQLILRSRGSNRMGIRFFYRAIPSLPIHHIKSELHAAPRSNANAAHRALHRGECRQTPPYMKAAMMAAIAQTNRAPISAQNGSAALPWTHGVRHLCAGLIDGLAGPVWLATDRGLCAKTTKRR
jgi:hypothetical protein